jgi:hypothetical protein
MGYYTSPGHKKPLSEAEGFCPYILIEREQIGINTVQGTREKYNTL